ncbi:TPA: hypothetical protein DDW35_09940, partial [Candidatus Sumerlaeota bacterium]|nr:hypothetical protein [Candidatus Sumerlaeota bacterium]
MESILGLLVMGILAGGIALLLGVVAFFSQGGMRQRIEALEAQVRALNKLVSETKRVPVAQPVTTEKLQEAVSAPTPKIEEVVPVVISPPPAPNAKIITEFIEPVEEAPSANIEASELVEPLKITEAPVATAPSLPAETPIEKPEIAAKRLDIPREEDIFKYSPQESQQLELLFGTKWLLWAGITTLLFGIAYLVKYAHDNSWIGPQGRLFGGVIMGLVMLGAGEWSRRKKWMPLFQALTGGGCAVFYICVYFSAEVYELSGQKLSFGLAALVTALTIALAVARNALPIGMLALIGGFLSPVLLSTGENKPYTLFSYLLILDMVALCAAYYRKWRALDFMAFIGTTTLYAGWFFKYYGVNGPLDQMEPALLFATIFYALFLVIPCLYHLVRRATMGGESLTLLVLNAIFAFSCYYRILYEPYEHILCLVILAQAALMFGVFLALRRRVPEDRVAQESVLVITLALAITALPMYFQLYGIVLAWAIQGALFLYIGVRYGRLTLRLGGTAALALSVAKLLYLLPLHTEAFRPILNVPFASWTLVAALLVGISIWLSRADRPQTFKDLQILIPTFCIAGYSVFALLL